MEKVNFFNGMEVENTDLNDLELYFEERINKNQASLSDAGVLVNADLPDGTILQAPYLSTDNTTISIYGFVAYDQEGHLLYVAPSFVSGERVPTIQNLKPVSGTGSLANRELVNTGSTDNFGKNIEYLLVARYNEIYTNDLREQDTTDVLLHTRILPSVSFYLRETGTTLPNDVILGTITTDDFGNVYVNESTRDAFSIRGDLIVSNIYQTGEDLGTTTFEQHVNMLGSGEYSSNNPHAISPSDLGIDPAATGKHQQYEHSNGIVTDNKDSITSALFYNYKSAEGTSNINDIIFSVLALSSDYNEMAGIGNTSLYPSDFSGSLSTILYQDTTYSGFYILSLNQSASLTLSGPFESEQDTPFLNALADKSLLPICSFYWGIPRYYTLTFGGILVGSSTAVVGWNVLSTEELALYNSSDTIKASEVQIGTQVYYAPANDYLTVNSISTSVGQDFLSIKRVDSSSLKDRRPFNTLSLQNIKTSDLATIKTSAPFSQDTFSCYHARVISSKEDSAFLLSGRTLSVEFDGITYSPSLIFPDAAFYTAQDVVNEINKWIDSLYTSSNGVKPKALLNKDGRITLLASQTIIVQDVGINGAEDIIGFGSDNNSDADGILKTIISTGNLESIQDFYYNENGSITNIYYTLPSGVQKEQSITYTPNDGVESFTEVI